MSSIVSSSVLISLLMDPAMKCNFMLSPTTKVNNGTKIIIVAPILIKFCRQTRNNHITMDSRSAASTLTHSIMSLVIKGK